MIYERIKLLCKQNGISVNKLEEMIGVASGYLCKIDKHKPSHEKIQKIAECLNVSTEYLITGKEPTLNYLYTDENADFIIEMTKMTKDKNFINTITKYISLPDSNKKSIDDMIDFMYERENKKSGD